MKVKERKYYLIGFIAVIIVVTSLYVYLYINRIAIQDYMPQITPEHIIILVAFSFPASYISTMGANWRMKQTTDYVDCFKETIIRVALHWLIYLPLIMTYNYMIFGVFFPPYFGVSS